MRRRAAETLADTDNLGKPIQDALQGIIYQDDALVSDTLVRKRRIQSLREGVLSPLLADALARGGEFLHIGVEFISPTGDVT